LTVASALVAGLIGMTPLAHAQNTAPAAPQAAPIQKAPAANAPMPKAPVANAPVPQAPNAALPHANVAAPAAPAPQAAAPQTGASAKTDAAVTRRELAKFNGYLTRHPKVARELRKDPKLVNDPAFLAKHTGLEKFLAGHTAARTELKENPSAFMKKVATAEKPGKVTKHGPRSTKHAHSDKKS